MSAAEAEVRTFFQLRRSGAHTVTSGPVAVIDIGSNSVRLVVYERLARAVKPLFNEKVLCGLGRTLASTGELDGEGIERALRALIRFREILRLLEVKFVRAVATAAVREAHNGGEFILRAEEALAAPVEILGGVEEARLAAQGILMGTPLANGIAGDLGGGSLELIGISGAAFEEASSLPLGGLRLIDVSGGRLDKALAIADSELAALPWIGRARGRTFYAVGGTWRALARLHMAANAYPLRVIDGYAIPTSAAITFCEEVRKVRKVNTLPGIEHITRARREIVPYGALLLERLLRRLMPSRVIFSAFGIREGLLYTMLPEEERAKDPLLSFCEDYARERSRSLEHARELAVWTDALFQGPVHGADAEETPEERRLRHAACLLSDTGWQAHPDYRGDQTLNMVAHAALGGLDHGGRIFLALAVYFRHTLQEENSSKTLPARLAALAGRRSLRRARILGAAVRTAHMLSLGRPGVIGETPLSCEKNRLVLALPKRWAALDGERLRGRFATLAALTECEAEIRVAR